VLVFGRLAAALFLASCLAACSGLGQSLGVNTHCGPAPPVAAPVLFFDYPGNAATNVATNVGELVFQGFGATSVVVIANGVTVPTGPLQPAPSPLPSPRATAPPGLSGTPYLAATIGTLAPTTTYAVSFSFDEWDGTSPTCKRTVIQQLGSFST
jgi:hypothetical protein